MDSGNVCDRFVVTCYSLDHIECDLGINLIPFV